MAGEKPSITFAKGDAPEDKWHIIKILSFFAGFAVLFPSSALTASTDFYIDVYGEEKGDRLLFYMGLAITLTSPFVQLFIQSIQNRISYTSRIMICLAMNTILAGMFPFLVLGLDASISVYFVILICFLIGVNNAVLKVSFFSLTSYYPARYQQDIVFGKGLSPLLVVILKMTIKKIAEAFYPGDQSYAIRRGSVLFFVLAAFVPGLCAVIYRYARKTSLFSKHFFPSFRLRKLILAAQDPHTADSEQPSNIHPQMAALTPNNDQDELHFDQDSPTDIENSDDGDITTLSRNPRSFDNLNPDDFLPPSSLSSQERTNIQINVTGAANGEYVSLDDDENGDNTTTQRHNLASSSARLEAVGRTKSSFDPEPEIIEAKVNLLTVITKISLPAFILALTMFITYTVYPAILMKSAPTIELSKGWYKLWLLMAFAISDFITRSLPYSILTQICPVRSLDLVAYARILFIPLYAYSVYIHTISSQLLFIITLLFGASNGLVFVLALRNYSHLVKDHEKSTAGSFMSIAVVAGVLVGNLLAILIDVVGK